MKIFDNILFVVLLLTAGVTVIFAIIEGDAVLAWVLSMCLLSLIIRFAALKLSERLEENAQTEGRTYTQADLVKFGKYILSEKREQSIENKENLREVTDADIANAWHTSTDEAHSVAVGMKEFKKVSNMKRN